MDRYVHKTIGSVVRLEEIEILEVHAKCSEAKILIFILFQGLKLCISGEPGPFINRKCYPTNMMPFLMF